MGLQGRGVTLSGVQQGADRPSGVDLDDNEADSCLPLLFPPNSSSVFIVYMALIVVMEYVYGMDLGVEDSSSFYTWGICRSSAVLSRSLNSILASTGHKAVRLLLSLAFHFTWAEISAVERQSAYGDVGFYAS